MERELNIKLGENLYASGLLRGSLRRPVVVFVHGFSGHRNEHLFYNGARFFERHGFSSFRFNLYDWRPKRRKLWQCTLRTHADDLDKVVAGLRRRGAKRVFAIGHSYGAPTILLSRRQEFDAVSLWDPSRGAFLVREGTSVRSLKRYLLADSYEILFGEAMHREAKSLRWERLMMNFEKPVQIVCAGKGNLVNAGKRYYAEAAGSKAFNIIPGTTHCFDEDGAAEKLFQRTLAWFNRELKIKN